MSYPNLKFFNYLILIVLNLFLWSNIFNGILGFTKNQVYFPLLITLCILLVIKFSLALKSNQSSTLKQIFFGLLIGATVVLIAKNIKPYMILEKIRLLMNY